MKAIPVLLRSLGPSGEAFKQLRAAGMARQGLDRGWVLLGFWWSVIGE